MSRILAYPHMGTLKLYQVNSHVHMSSLKQYFNHLHPNTSYKTTYKFVEPHQCIPLKHIINKHTFQFVPEDDGMLIRTLKMFKAKVNIPYDTHIDIEAKRNIIENDHTEYIGDEYWKTFGVNQVGIINVSCRNIRNIDYEFRDTTNHYDNKNTSITLNEGQMIAYDENNLIEHKVKLINIVNHSNITVYDQLIFTL